jgi:SAM-dependent methyltransferase
MVRAPAGDWDYERHGHGYARYRQPDRRIAALVDRALGPARTVLNVGAGAGSYEPAGRYVLAVEPSAVMRAQRPRALAPAIDAVAEALPFDDGSIDAAMAMITIHQWPDAARGLAEMRRVARGPVVVMTFDGDALDRFWLAAYSPALMAAERRRYPAISEIRAALGGSAEVSVVPVPSDCTDGFTEAYYARPEKFLDDGARGAQSAWGFVTAAEQSAAVARLRADLESGAWDRQHGQWRHEPVFEGSLRLVVAHPSA